MLAAAGPVVDRVCGNTTHMWGSGLMTIVDPSFSTLERHASVFTPSIFMAHDPQMPSRHELVVVARRTSTGEEGLHGVHAGARREAGGT
jgi:hypothetical protein